jgi:hypothetical protein
VQARFWFTRKLSAAFAFTVNRINKQQHTS